MIPCSSGSTHKRFACLLAPGPRGLRWDVGSTGRMSDGIGQPAKEPQAQCISQSCFLTSLCTSSVAKDPGPRFFRHSGFTPLHGLQWSNSQLWCKPRKNGGPRLFDFHPITRNEECCSMTLARITGGPATFFSLCFLCFFSHRTAVR